MKYLYFLFSTLIILSSCSKSKSVNKKKPINPYYEKAHKVQESGDLHNAFLNFDKAKELFLQRKDSVGVGKSLIFMSIISADRGDYFGGQEILVKALDYFDKTKKSNFVYIESYYNELGSISYHLKNYSEAITFYEQALNYPNERSSPIVIKNNIANAYRRKNEYSKALAIYESILKDKISESTFAMVLANFAYTKWLKNQNYNAVPELLKALNIRETENDLNGQNTSYAFLADYYGQKQPNVALLYASKMYRVAKQINNPNDQLEALKKLIKFSPEKTSKQYFEIYQDLKDSIQIINNTDKNQFALIRYETEKSKADNLKLQKDNTEKKYQIIKRELLLYIALLVLISAAVIGFIWYKKRKQRLELEAQNTIRENQLKTSKKVHDVVANGLYRVMTEIENREDIDKEHILDKIDDMYQKSRDISYDKPQTTNPHFNDKLTTLLQTFETETIKIVALGNTDELWEKVSAQVKFEVEHILQELLVNMDKHSKATEVTLQFEQSDNHIDIYYTDNGIGLSKDTVFKNGLTNTGNRIAHIHGTLTFDTETEKGLKIKLSFPIS